MINKGDKKNKMINFKNEIADINDIKTINRDNIKKEIININNELNNIQRISKNIINRFVDYGYTIAALGSGKQSCIKSKEVQIKHLNNSYIKGHYLVIGLSNVHYGGGTMYRGLIKKII